MQGVGGGIAPGTTMDAAANTPAREGAPYVTAFAIDLHNHMPIPDGDYRGPMHTTAEEIVAAAAGAGIDILGVTDHYALDFFHRVHAAAAESPARLLVLPGAELRLGWGDDEAHLIATFPHEECDGRFAELLRRVGYDDTARTGPLSHVVVEHDPLEAARTIAELGGICHVAHVDRVFGDYRLLGCPLLERMVEDSPVMALEFVDIEHTWELGDLAGRVACIQSSDSHDTAEIGRRRTIIEADDLSFEGLYAALAARCANVVR